MMEALKTNRITTFFGILTVVSEILRAQPDLLNFLPDNIKGYVFGSISTVCAIVAAVSARDRETKKQIKATKVSKALNKKDLKSEIKEELIVEIPKAIEIKEEEEHEK